MVVRSTDKFHYFFHKSAINEFSCNNLLFQSPITSPRDFPQSRYSQLPFKTQRDFVRSLEPRTTIKCASKVDYLTRTIRFSDADSKTIIFNKHGLLYDIAPHWLRHLPESFTNTVGSTALEEKFSECFFSRANLSFSHFVATDLPQILIANRLLPHNVPIVMPWLEPWQKSLLEFFGITRRVFTFPQNSNNNPFITVGFTSSYAIEDLSEYEGLHYCRAIAQSQLQATNCNNSYYERPIVWIGRHSYETSRGLKSRVQNLRDIVPIMKAHSILYVDPVMHPLESVANLVYNASLVISESGSHFINYLLFANSTTPIIQFAPHGTLTPTWSYYNVNNMQWYHPVASQLYFYGGTNPLQSNREYGSPWNTPSTYEPLGLSRLISYLHHV